MLYRKRIIKVAVETTPGAKVAGTTDVLCEDLEIKAEAPFEQRRGSGVYLGNSVPGILGERIGSCKFTVELRCANSVTFTMPKAQYRELSLGERDGLMIYDASGQLNNSSGSDWLTINKGAGTLGSGIDALLQGCGFSLSTNTYSPLSVLSTQKTLSIDCWEDGNKKGLAGAMGKLTIEAETGKRVLLKFEFMGIWQTPVVETMPSFSPGATAVLRASNGAFTIGAAEKRISKLTIDCGQQLAPRYTVASPAGVAFYSVTDYDPTVSFDLESELVSAYDINGAWLAGTEASIVFTAA